MPNCPKCDKPVYFAERKTSLGKDWHAPCLRCEKCNKTLVPGRHAEHEGRPYCDKPCYSSLFGPKASVHVDTIMRCCLLSEKGNDHYYVAYFHDLVEAASKAMFIDKR